jgi:hypothetical protein
MSDSSHDKTYHHKIEAECLAHGWAIEKALEADLAFWESEAAIKAQKEGKPELEIRRDCTRAMIAAYNAAMGEARDWQRIGTAPTDGSEFDLWTINPDDRVTNARWNEDRKRFEHWGPDGWERMSWVRIDGEATHWMPCPTPPKGQRP